ncbi:MAG: recombinase family protein [Firmicutes bacterium]|nr:recombinase family protein [Bacillota bacterium]
MNNSKYIGYARVSTNGQHEDRQVLALTQFGVAKNKIFIDKVSGKDFDRTQYKRMIKKLKEGNILVIKSIDRLGRNYDEIMEQWRNITKVIKADIMILDMPLLDTTKNKDLLGTFISDIVLQLLSFIAQNERENIRQRQAEGIAVAKAKGVKFGRPIKFEAKEYAEVVNRYKEGKLTKQEVMEIIGCGERTFYRIVKENGR